MSTNLIKRLKKKMARYNGAKKALCMNCGKLGTKHYMEQFRTDTYQTNFRFHCPTTVEGQYHTAQLFERGTNLDYLQRKYEKRHKLV